MAKMKLVNCEDVVSIAHYYHSEFDMALADLNDLKEVLYDCPTIDAKPVVHAYWKDTEEHNVAFCTKCGLAILKTQSKVFRYCPACGAQMDEVVE